MAAAVTPEEDVGALSGALVRVIIIASFGPLLLNLSSTTVNVAIDKLMVQFHSPLSTVQWVVTGYLLALALVLPTFRWAVERLGSRRLYVACLLAFTATSALSALAWSAQSLVAFRVLQGAVGGLLAPLAQALIAQLAGPKRMGRAVGIVSIPVLVAPLFGPVLGGLLVQHLSWRWLFLFNAPLGLAGAWIAHRRLPLGTTATRTPLDFVGLLLLSPGMGFFTYALASMGRTNTGLSAKVVVPAALAVVLVAAFVLDARRRPTTALIDLRLFKHGAVVAGLTAFLLTSVGTFGAQLILPLYYQQVRGESAMGAGLLLAPQGLGMLFTLPQVGRLTDRFDHGTILITGVVMTLLGTIAFTLLTDHSPYWLLAASLVVRGAGLGATSTPALSAAYKHLSRDEIPNATTAINIVQRLGAPIGTATLAMALQRFTAGLVRTDATRPLFASAFAHTFAIAAGLSAISLVPGIALARMKPPASHPERT